MITCPACLSYTYQDRHTSTQCHVNRMIVSDVPHVLQRVAEKFHPTWFIA